MSLSKYPTYEDYKAAVEADGKRTKPVVRCSKVTEPEAGCTCLVIPKDHPASYLNDQIARTSTIQRVSEDLKEFETMNTIYVFEK